MMQLIDTAISIINPVTQLSVPNKHGPLKGPKWYRQKNPRPQAMEGLEKTTWNIIIYFPDN